MNFKFAGAGTIPGGEYEKVSVSGSAKLAGDVKCASFSASGALGGSGSVNCSGEMHLSGSASIDGPICARLLKASGSFRCKSILSSGEIRCSGATGVDGDIEAELLRIAGSISCSGLLNAETIEIRMDGRSRAGSIGGSSIDIRLGSSSGNTILIIFGKSSKHTASLEVSESIEGDDIYLEWVSAPKVTGRRVVIGPGCSIGLVQYSESADISPDAVVDCVEQV